MIMESSGQWTSSSCRWECCGWVSLAQRKEPTITDLRDMHEMIAYLKSEYPKLLYVGYGDSSFAAALTAGTPPR